MGPILETFTLSPFGYLAIINIFDTNKGAGGITTGEGGVCAAFAVITSIVIRIFAAEVLSITVNFNLKKKSSVIFPFPKHNVRPVPGKRQEASASSSCRSGRASWHFLGSGSS